MIRVGLNILKNILFQYKNWVEHKVRDLPGSTCP